MSDCFTAALKQSCQEWWILCEFRRLILSAVCVTDTACSSWRHDGRFICSNVIEQKPTSGHMGWPSGCGSLSPLSRDIPPPSPASSERNTWNDLLITEGRKRRSSREGTVGGLFLGVFLVILVLAGDRSVIWILFLSEVRLFSFGGLEGERWVRRPRLAQWLSSPYVLIGRDRQHIFILKC